MPASEGKQLSFWDKSEPNEVSAAVATELRIYAGRRWPTMNHKWRKARLASLLGMNERRVKSLYEAAPTARVRQDEVARITALIGAEQENASGQADRALAARLASLEAQVAGLLEEVARVRMASESGNARQSGSSALGLGQGAFGRRSTD